MGRRAASRPARRAWAPAHPESNFDLMTLMPNVAATPNPRSETVIGGSFVRQLVPIWLVTAAWDFVCATALSVFAYHTSAARLWQGVAATVLGPKALEGGAATVAIGVLLHLTVALTWSAVFLVAARAWPALREAIATPAGALGVAAAYGPVIWLVMSLVVI